jgi:hypothetical protein
MPLPAEDSETAGIEPKRSGVESKKSGVDLAAPLLHHVIPPQKKDGGVYQPCFPPFGMASATNVYG